MTEDLLSAITTLSRQKKNIARIRGELDRRSWLGDIGATWYQADIAWDDGHQWVQVHHATSQWVQVV